MFAPRGWMSRPLARRIYKTIAASELFDKSWYRRHQMRGPSKLTDPLWHFLALGRKHQLDPSPMFDTEHYISSHPDVRDSNLNPLFHYLEYGVGERRQPIRSVQETFDHLFPDARELPTFLTPRIGNPRLTVLIDQATITRTDLTLRQVLDVSATQAVNDSRELRVISLLAENTELVHHAAELSLSRRVGGLDIVTAPPHRETTSYEVHDDEIFLATSWTSAAAIRHAGQPDNLWFLGAGGVEASAPELWRSLSLGNALGAGVDAEATVTLTLAQESTRASTPGTLVIDAATAGSPELYAWTLVEVEAMLREHPTLTEGLSIALVGETLRPVSFLHSVTALVTPRMPGEGSTLRVTVADLLDEGSVVAALRALLADRGVR